MTCLPQKNSPTKPLYGPAVTTTLLPSAAEPRIVLCAAKPAPTRTSSPHADRPTHVHVPAVITADAGAIVAIVVPVPDTVSKVFAGTVSIPVLMTPLVKDEVPFVPRNCGGGGGDNRLILRMPPQDLG